MAVFQPALSSASQWVNGPKPVHLSGTTVKYCSIAAQNLLRYNSGHTIVGKTLPAVFLRYISSLLSKVNVLT